MTHLIPVGNSLGVRIPKPIIAQVGFDTKTELSFKVTDEGLLITPVRQAREGWEKAFKGTRKQRKDPLSLEKIVNKFDQREWEW